MGAGIQKRSQFQLISNNNFNVTRLLDPRLINF